MKKYLIIYHQEDNDGVCSAAIIKHYLINILKIDNSEIDLLPATYNLLSKLYLDKTIENWPKEYNHIIITDISFNDWKVMKWLADTFKDSFTWIDHHAPIINLSKQYGFDQVNGIRDTSHSAIWNAYKYLYDPFMQNEFPYVVRMLSAWDSWTYEQEGIDKDECRAFNIGCTINSELSVKWYMWHMEQHILSNDFKTLESFVSQMFADGNKEIARQNKLNEELIRTNGDKEWNVNGIPAIMVVTTGQTSSLMFESLQVKNPTKSDLKVGAVFKHCADGNWTLSLYNIYDWKGDTSNPYYFHCGKYLQEKYQGGGHEGAAGCTINVNQFYKMLKSKTI